MSKLKELETQLEELKEGMKQYVRDAVGVSEVLIMNDAFISIKATMWEQVQRALTTYVPNDTPIITLCNNYYHREMRIEYESDDVKYWIEINVGNLPYDITKHIVRVERALYDTEEVYVSMQSHTAKFKRIRVESYSFLPEYKQEKYYGGNVVLTDLSAAKQICYA
jgi:hypothetical protein